MPDIADLELLAGSDLASSTLESYGGYKQWNDKRFGKKKHSNQEAMGYSRSTTQGLKQGFMYGITAGLAALRKRLRYMYVYGTNENLR